MSGIPQFLEPRLRLFLSADLVGSTALKQSPRDGTLVSTEWYVIIQGFYSEAQKHFARRWSDFCSQLDKDDWGPAPELWKVIGDEVVFTKELTHHRQAYGALVCWCMAMQDVRRFIRSRAPRLDIKCTAWTAGFPVMNKEVVVWSSEDDSDFDNFYLASGKLLNEKYEGTLKTDLKVDYIGPAIDIGFRLSTHAMPRKLILGVGLAYILSVTTPLVDDRYPEFRFNYDGAAPLKGVFGGVPYPIFWIDMASTGDLSLLEDELAPRPKFDRDAMRRFCLKYYDENKTYTFPPFISLPSEPQLNLKPEWYDSTLSALAANFTSDTQEIGEESAAEAETPPKASDQPTMEEVIATMKSSDLLGKTRN